MIDERLNNNYCVYVHTSPSGKMYVGQTKLKPERRWGKDGHRYLSKRKNGKYMHPAFAKAIIKYGWNNIEHEIIASNLTRKEADKFEKVLIEKLNTMNPKFGYNCKEGGVGGNFSEETLKKMSESHKGVSLSEEHKRKISEANKGENNWNFGGHLKEETKKKISATLKGNTISEEIKIKISNSLKGKRMGADRIGSKKIVQYDTKGNFVKIWDSIADAERALKLSKGNIGKCCNNVNGYCKTVGGYIWRNFGDELTQEYIDKCNRRKDERCVVQYSLHGEFICMFNSIKNAERETNINHNNISSCCKGKRKTAGGYIWKYYEDTEVAI